MPGYYWLIGCALMVAFVGVWFVLDPVIDQLLRHAEDEQEEGK